MQVSATVMVSGTSDDAGCRYRRPAGAARQRLLTFEHFCGFYVGLGAVTRSRQRRPKDALSAFGAFAAAPCMG